jgi:hypothetical protein
LWYDADWNSWDFIEDAAGGALLGLGFSKLLRVPKGSSTKPMITKGTSGVVSNFLDTGWVNRITRSADDVNISFIEKGYKAPYKKGTVVTEYITSETEKFVRVHGKDNKYSSWMMKKSEIDGLNPVEIQNRFALPETPTYISDVSVPEGIKLRMGTAEAVPEWGNAGAIQYELLQRIDNNNFTNTRLIE